MSLPPIGVLIQVTIGGLIASVAFWWAVRSGELSDATEAKYLVFDDEDDVARPSPAPPDRTP